VATKVAGRSLRSPLRGPTSKGRRDPISLFPLDLSSHDVDNFRWIALIFVFSLMSVLGVIVPNFLRQKDPATWRTHNREKIFTECLASHQMIYFSFYLTMIIVMRSSFSEFTLYLMAGYILLSLIFFWTGHYSASNQDQRIRKAGHGCVDIPCTAGLGVTTKLKVFGLNLVMAAVSLAVSLTFALNPALVKRPTPAPVPTASTQAAP